jgi:hypothetical protein
MGLAMGTATIWASQACSTPTSGTGPVDGGGTDATTISSEGGEDAALAHESSTDTGSVDGPRDVQTDQGTDAADAGAVDAEAGDANVPDVGVDADAGADASPCTGLLCNGACISDPDCLSCAGATLLCAPRGECVANCSACSTADAALPTECFSCDQTHQNPVGTCQPADPGSFCLSGNYFGSYDGGAGYHCGCSSGDAGECPGESQVCVAFGGSPVCVTCGEPTPSGSGTLSCKRAGTTCNAGTGQCN